MLTRALVLFTFTMLALPVPMAGAAIVPYSQDFEGLVQTNPNALANDGWLVYGNVFTPAMAYIYGYGPYPAPNHGLAFSQIVLGEGGVPQGAQQLVVYSDYQNADHAVGNIIESNVYREWTIAPADTGLVWYFAFQAKRGNIAGNSTAKAFIKTLDPANGYALTNFVTVDMTSIPTTWGGYNLQLRVGAGLVGQIFQIGFLNTATNYQGSGIFYDNILFYSMDPTGAPDVPVNIGATLGANYPNPFSPGTRIAFSVEVPGRMDLAVFDLTGRKVATLRNGEFAAGEYEASWDGRTDDGAPAASGRYWYVLSTSTGRLVRSMTLVK